MKKTQILVFLGLLIAMEIILTRFLSFQTPIVRISFGFIPIAFASIMFGPAIGGVAAMIADILGMLIFPKGAYFPGFTFSALLTGAIYGLLLHKKSVTVVRVTLAVVAITLFVDLGLNTLWLTMITNKAAALIIVPRLVKSLVFIPIQVAMLFTLWRYVGNYLLGLLRQEHKMV